MLEALYMCRVRKKMCQDKNTAEVWLWLNASNINSLLSTK